MIQKSLNIEKVNGSATIELNMEILEKLEMESEEIVDLLSE